MKARILLFIAALVLLISGCVVFSFYPLYTEKDLFPNEILTGDWLEMSGEGASLENDEATWSFIHPYLDEKKKTERDSLSYVLTLDSEENGKEYTSVFLVHLVKLGGHYFLDFYLKDYPDDGEIRLSTFHVIPVHTIAKLTIEEDVLRINWFNPDWLAKLIRENKIRIHHEESDDLVLLTAKPQELQKFVTKYVNSEEAFDDGLEVVLHRKK